MSLAQPRALSACSPPALDSGTSIRRVLASNTWLGHLRWVRASLLPLTRPPALRSVLSATPRLNAPALGIHSPLPTSLHVDLALPLLIGRLRSLQIAAPRYLDHDLSHENLDQEQLSS
ncbi:hypothetical protein MTO96_003590 [Rhipicephalus appendiculatus]